MITERDLQEAIAECQGQRNPNANTCIKLAAFLTIQKELFGNPEPLGNSDRFSYSGPVETIVRTIDYPGDTDFSRAVDGKDPAKVLPVLDEIMEAVMVFNKPLYDAAIRKLDAI